MKAFNVDDVTLTSQLMASYRKINIACEKIINYKVIPQVITVAKLASQFEKDLEFLL